MPDPTREEGFLFVESGSGDLTGRVEFYRTKEEAESAATEVVQKNDRSFPVFVIPATRFVTEQIRAMRGSSFK